MSGTATKQCLRGLRSVRCVSVMTFRKARNSTVCLGGCLSAVFRVSSILVSGSRITVTLGVVVSVPSRPGRAYISRGRSNISGSRARVVLRGITGILTTRKFPYFSYPHVRYGLLPLSSSYEGTVVDAYSLTGMGRCRCLLIVSYGGSARVFRFRVQLVPTVPGRIWFYRGTGEAAAQGPWVSQRVIVITGM